MYGKAYSNLLISENAFNTVCRLEEELAPVFRRIESIECENEAKVLAAFHKNRVAAHYFNPTTGYGYDDIGRDNLDKRYSVLRDYIHMFSMDSDIQNNYTIKTNTLISTVSLFK